MYWTRNRLLLRPEDVAGTWVGSHGVHPEHLCSQFGGLDPIFIPAANPPGPEPFSSPTLSMLLAIGSSGRSLEGSSLVPEIVGEVQ